MEIQKRNDEIVKVDKNGLYGDGSKENGLRAEGSRNGGWGEIFDTPSCSIQTSTRSQPFLSSALCSFPVLPIPFRFPFLVSGLPSLLSPCSPSLASTRFLSLYYKPFIFSPFCSFPFFLFLFIFSLLCLSCCLLPLPPSLPLASFPFTFLYLLFLSVPSHSLSFSCSYSLCFAFPSLSPSIPLRFHSFLPTLQQTLPFYFFHSFPIPSLFSLL